MLGPGQVYRASRGLWHAGARTTVWGTCRLPARQARAKAGYADSNLTGARARERRRCRGICPIRCEWLADRARVRELSPVVGRRARDFAGLLSAGQR